MGYFLLLYAKLKAFLCPQHSWGFTFKLNISASLTEADTVKINYNTTYLKQAIDLMFAFLLSENPGSLKICKHCGNVFIANNPKAEYCSYSCKNQANVYKRRAKNK